MKTLLSLLLLCVSLIASSQIEIELRRSFIDSIKNKVTVSTNYFIDKSHDNPNSPSKDGDLHFAGRASTIQLAVVAEIMNAKKVPESVDFVKANQNTNSPVTVNGAWRIWCEHANQHEDFTQGETLTAFTSTNPPHVFEIHPVTKVGTATITDETLRGISGFKYKDAEQAFTRYAGTRFSIDAEPSTIRMNTAGVGYNYVKFKLELDDAGPLEVDDGLFAFCKVLTLNDEIISHKVRMAFVKGSYPYTKIKSMNVGDRMKVVGIPRISLALVSWRVKQFEDTGDTDALEWNLPYEIVVVAVVK